VKRYTEGIVHSYEQRLETIWSMTVNRVHVLDFEGLTPRMRQDLAVRLRMVYTREGQQVMSDTEMGLDVVDTLCFLLGGIRRRMTWRQFILALGLHTDPEMAEAGHAEGRKTGARFSGGHFIGRLAMHFGLVSNEGLKGLQVVTQELPLINLHELGRLNICSRYRDTWAWVAQGPERQQVVAAGAHGADTASPAADEGAQEILPINDRILSLQSFYPELFNWNYL
ncbi:hypothetical protein Tco_0562334, partial [Tanacetum coccineum]